MASRLQGEIHVPASKSHTIRAVAIAAMAHGTSVLSNPLMSDDAQSALSAAAREMGATSWNWERNWIIHGNWRCTG